MNRPFMRSPPLLPAESARAPCLRQPRIHATEVSRFQGDRMPRRAMTAVVPGRATARASAPVRGKKRRSLLGRLLTLAVILTVWGFVVMAGIVIWAARDLPRPESAMDAARRPALVLQDRGGHTI